MSIVVLFVMLTCLLLKVGFAFGIFKMRNRVLGGLLNFGFCWPMGVRRKGNGGSVSKLNLLDPTKYGMLTNT